MEASGQRHAPAAVSLGKEPPVPIGWVGPTAGPDRIPAAEPRIK
jgi:hypothetical protein